MSMKERLKIHRQIERENERNWIQSAHSFCGFCGQAVKWE